VDNATVSQTTVERLAHNVPPDTTITPSVNHVIATRTVRMDLRATSGLDNVIVSQHSKVSRVTAVDPTTSTTRCVKNVAVTLRGHARSRDILSAAAVPTVMDSSANVRTEWAVEFAIRVNPPTGTFRSQISTDAKTVGAMLVARSDGVKSVTQRTVSASAVLLLIVGAVISVSTVLSTYRAATRLDVKHVTATLVDLWIRIVTRQLVNVRANHASVAASVKAR